MRTFGAFIKKEWMENCRTGKLWISLVLFFLMGIMNPAITKLTPKLMELVSEDSSSSGMVIEVVQIDAFSSWMQFYKNMPTGLIVFVLLFAGVFATEYQKGTLVLAISKGADKSGIFWAKSLIILSIWTVAYIICFLVTWFYTGYYWDNSIMNSLFMGAFMYFLFGINVIACLLLFAVISNNSYMAILATGAYVLVQYFFNMFDAIAKYLPVNLTNGMELGIGNSASSDYIPAITVSIFVTAFFLVMGNVCFKKMQKS